MCRKSRIITKWNLKKYEVKYTTSHGLPLSIAAPGPSPHSQFHIGWWYMSRLSPSYSSFQFRVRSLRFMLKIRNIVYVCVWRQTDWSFQKEPPPIPSLVSIEAYKQVSSEYFRETALAVGGQFIRATFEEIHRLSLYANYLLSQVVLCRKHNFNSSWRTFNKFNAVYFYVTTSMLNHHKGFFQLYLIHYIFLENFVFFLSRKVFSGVKFQWPPLQTLPQHRIEYWIEYCYPLGQNNKTNPNPTSNHPPTWKGQYLSNTLPASTPLYIPHLWPVFRNGSQEINCSISIFPPLPNYINNLHSAPDSRENIPHCHDVDCGV